MKQRNVILKAGTELMIRIVDSKGNYVSQINVVVPENIKTMGTVDIKTYIFGDINKVIDC